MNHWATFFSEAVFTPILTDSVIFRAFGYHPAYNGCIGLFH